MNKKTLMIFAAIGSLATTSYAVPDPSLVAWYKFDETSGTTAANEVSGSTAGTITGGVTVNQTGISGGAYLFNDSNGYVDMGNANFFSSITTSGQLTLSAWVKTGVTTGNRNTILFAGDDTKTQTYIDLGYSGTGTGTPSPSTPGRAYTRVRPNNISAGTGVDGIFTPAVNNNAWDHLVMTMNVSTSLVSIYMNGTLQSTMTLTSPNNVFPTFNNFEVGRLGRSSPTDYFGGLIDDVQVYSSALTGTQVNWLFNNPGQALAAVPEPEEVSLVIAIGLGLLIALRCNCRRADKAAA